MRNVSRRIVSALLAASWMGGVSESEGAVITPTAVFASSYFGNPDQHPNNLINDSGLDTSSGNVLAYTHATHDNALGMWHAGAGQGTGGGAPVVVNQYVVFDLGDNYDLTLAYLWQMAQPSGANNSNLGRGINEFRLLASPDAPNPAYVASPPTKATFDLTGFSLILDTSTLAIGTTSPATTQTFALTGATNVRQVYLDIRTAHSGVNNYVGLSEIKFEGTLIPEPNSILLMVLGSGLGIVCVARRGAIRAGIV